jgi:transmembrane sensor
VHGAKPNRDLLAPTPSGAVSRWRRRAAWFIPGALAAAAAVVLGVFLARTEKPSDATAMAIAAGQIGLIERRTLEDGSIVELNRGAELRVSFSTGERHIELSRGEAHFQVAKDPNRPFTVRAGTVTVRAIGTAFNVQRRTASVDVLVTEGTVDVRTPKPAHPGEREAVEAARVEAGHRCVVSLASDSPPAVIAVTPEDTARLLAWQPAVLACRRCGLRRAGLRRRLGEGRRHARQRRAPLRLGRDPWHCHASGGRPPDAGRRQPAGRFQRPRGRNDPADRSRRHELCRADVGPLRCVWRPG